MQTRFNVSKWGGVLGLLLITAFVRPVIGQDAKLIIVEKSDSARLKNAYTEFQDAKAKWEKLKTEISNTYTQGRAGWDKVEFSVDFRAMVQWPMFTYSGWTNASTGRTGPVGTIPYFTGTTGTVASDDNTLTFMSPYGSSDLVTIRDSALENNYLEPKTIEVKAKRVK